MEVTVKLYALGYREAKTYLLALLFVVGNILLPQLCHLVHLGGPTWLPIYFFTLVAAYKYGMRVGLLTALLSPLINSALFGMPAAAILPIILIKSTLLAIAAACAARLFGKVSIVAILLTVLAYQVVGTLAEWAMVQDFHTAVQDFRVGAPGMLVQGIGGFFALKAIAKV